MVAVEKTLLLVNDTAPNPTAPMLWNRMCQLMSTAQKRLWMVTPYLVMDSAMRDDLTAVCASAPEDVKVLVNSRETGNNIIASADYTIHRPMAERLGIPLWEFCGGWSMHTKSVLIDDNLSLIGSFNFDPRSAYLDTELMLAVYSEGLNAQLAATHGLPLVAECAVPVRRLSCGCARRFLLENGRNHPPIPVRILA